MKTNEIESEMLGPYSMASGAKGRAQEQHMPMYKTMETCTDAQNERKGRRSGLLFTCFGTPLCGRERSATNHMEVRHKHFFYKSHLQPLPFL